jgi:hypothetical protein
VERSSYSFSTLALDVGEWSASRPSHALAPGKGPPVRTVHEAGWTPEPVCTQTLQEKSFHLCRESNLDRPVVQPVARHYTDWASSAPTRLQGTISLKTHILIHDTVRTSNLILFSIKYYVIFLYKTVVISNFVLSSDMRTQDNLPQQRPLIRAFKKQKYTHIFWVWKWLQTKYCRQIVS